MFPGNRRIIKDDPWALCPVMTSYLANSKLGGPVGAGGKHSMSQGYIIFTTRQPGVGKTGSTQEPAVGSW